MDADQVVEMAFNSLELGLHILTQGGGYLDMVSGQFDLHA
jgi:hypothetical protein